VHVLISVRLPRLGAIAGSLLALMLVSTSVGGARAQAEVRGQPQTPAPAAGAQADAAGDVSSAGSAATSPHVAEARVLFQRGVELTKRGDYANAAKRFREALDLHHAPSIAYNLATVLSELGRHAEAYDTVQSVLRDATTPEALRVRAARLEESLQRSVARLTVIVSSEQSDVSILVDDAPLAPELVSVTRAVAPGDHVVLAMRAGVRISERRVRIPTGTAALVDVSLVMTPREAAEAAAESHVVSAATPPTDTRHDDGGDAKRRRRYWIVGGASAVAVGVGVALAVILAKPSTHAEAPVAGDSMPGVLVWR
jgi:hypothetical protein